MEFKPFKIGKYLLLERLAVGGMAELYRAKASGAGGFEKQLAIKRILPTYSQNEEFQRMFEYEARLSSMLTHSNIVQVYDFVKLGETYLLALEYIDGKNLRQFVNKSRKRGFVPPIEFSIYVINEVCKGLEYAHKKKDDITGRPLNIIHRDMSPQNIMLSYEGAVKIVDFGIAKAKDRVDETRSGVIKGKFGYMSPEQANGHPIDHRTDLFSTAIILWELLTGKRLFAADNDMATLKLIQECVIPSPIRANPKVSRELEKIVLKGLTKEITLRYQSAGAFHRALQEYLNKHYPTFTLKEAGDILQRTFEEEIENEKKRFEQVYRQSIPFSQGAPKNEDDSFADIEEALDGDITKSGSNENTGITSTDHESEASESMEIKGSAPSARVTNDKTVVSEEIPLRGENTSLESASELSMALLEDDKQGTQVSHPSPSDDKSLGTLADENERTQLKDAKTGSGLSLREAPTPHPSITAAPSEKTQVSGITISTDENDVGAEDIVLGKDSMRNPSRERPAENTGEKTKTPTSTEELSLVTLAPRAARPAAKEREKIEVPDPPAPQRRYYPEREDYLPRRSNRTLISVALALATVSSAGYLYHVYTAQELPTIIEQINSRLPGSNRAADPATDREYAEHAPRGDCTIQIDSDPAGATVYVSGLPRGVTSTTVSLPCEKNFRFEIHLEGFEPYLQDVSMKAHMERMYVTLKRIPIGKLELITDRNARIYVDGQFAGEAQAGQLFEKVVRANQRHKIRFVNEIFKIDTVREFSVAEDRVEHVEIHLVEPMRR